MDSINKILDFVDYLRNPLVLQRILNLNNINQNLLIQILRRANQRKKITAYNLLRARVNEEGLLVNITDGLIIGKSAEMIWKGFTPAEKNTFTTLILIEPVEKSTFTTYASQIRSRFSI
ncbi:3438_t:CDS:2 [Cetraspora pellucida]|uniref:3438_t:CDS:1 n=1 Tax=Cetraspora pellucida TaxID=1433469 RepID=A0A9N9CXT5_9GLOM|nr:3438_t:CDS:2 [Cetraspora pellucida]